jgi:hypothetical protein
MKTVAGNYKFDKSGPIDRGDELRCFDCGVVNNKGGTISYLWMGIRPDVRPSMIELCAACHDEATHSS